MPYLTAISQDKTESKGSWPLARRITSLGRASENDIEIPDAAVHEQHAIFICEGPHISVRPVDKSTPVRVQGKRVRRKRVLDDGDEVALGEFQLHYTLLARPDQGSDAESKRPSGVEDQRRLTGFRSMHRLSLRALKTQEVQELLENVLDAVIELSSADRGFLLLLDGEDYNVYVARNIDAESLTDDGQQISDSVVQRVLDTGTPLIISDARAHEDFRNARSVVDLQLCSVLCVPLLHRGGLLGVIYVGNNQVTNLFDHVHLELVEIFAAQLALIIANAILVNEIREDNRHLKTQLRERRFGSLIGASSAMQPVFQTVERVAPTQITVLITGATGTGKELVAREIHRRSSRSDGPFITLNCGAIPETLLESELFGHEKGAFTGASTQRNGHFQMAQGGTIFLDEIGELPVGLQAKLLRVLQERTVTRVGGNQSQSVDIRIVAATNRDLQERIADGEFREDLYFRLHVVEISLPPLAERGDDIVLIARFLIDEICQEFGLSKKRLGADAIRAMRKYSWPGNVGEVQNRLKKALVLADSPTLSASDLDLDSEEDLAPLMPLADAKEEFALKYILDALRQNGGNRAQTARDLGVDPRTIFRYLKKNPTE